MRLVDASSRRVKIAIVAAVAALPAVGCAGQDAQVQHSAAYDLYSIDHNGGPASENDPALAPYKDAIARLHRGCTNPDDELRDAAFAVADKVRKDTGRTVTTLQVLRAVALGIGTRPDDCNRAFALVGVLIENNS